MGLRLGDAIPDFTAETTEGTIQFHEWVGNSWCVFFSHPKDFTPVCTTELGRVANLKKQFEKKGAKIIAISVDSMEAHKGWIPDINDTQKTKINYPIIADPERRIAMQCDMLDPTSKDNLTARTVYIIAPDKKIKLMITYPASTGRNFDEILRALDSVQLTANYSVATPVDWKYGEDCIIVPSVSDEDAQKKFPKGFNRVKPYLRITPQPNL
jgi:alkyl hydroperoxide reductase subunit AhpC